MLKDAAAAAGGAILLTPLGMPFVMHGVAGMLVGGAGLFVADSLLKQVLEVVDTSQKNSGSASDTQEGNAPDSGEI